MYKPYTYLPYFSSGRGRRGETATEGTQKPGQQALEITITKSVCVCVKNKNKR